MDEEQQTGQTSEKTRNKRNHRKRNDDDNDAVGQQGGGVAVLLIPGQPSSFTMATTSRKLLVISIGNPPPHSHTLHSVAHTVLTALTATLSYPPFQKSHLLTTTTNNNNNNSSSGLLSQSPDPEVHPYTLWQSLSFMNESGRGVRVAWEGFLRGLVAGEERSRAALVIVHDELDLGLGKMRVRKGRGSARGHNGIKSCLENLHPTQPFTRLAVGIGRPVSRESSDVSAFVLRKMTPVERQKIEGEATPAVLKALRELAFTS